jgi:hypothetical protein
LARIRRIDLQIHSESSTSRVRPGVGSDPSEEVAPGVFGEFDPNGNPIGIVVISIRRSSGEIAPVQAAAG